MIHFTLDLAHAVSLISVGGAILTRSWFESVIGDVDHVRFVTTKSYLRYLRDRQVVAAVY